MNRRSRAFEAVTKTGALEILTFLFDTWCKWKTGKRQSPHAINKSILSGLQPLGNKKISTRTFNDSLRGLVELNFVDRDGRNYCVSDLGLYLCPLLKDIQSFFPSKRTVTYFSEGINPRSWVRETASIVTGTAKELLITTRWLDSFDNEEVKESLVPDFHDAAKRKVQIKVIADKDISRTTKEILEEKINAQIGIVPYAKLEKPPKALKPVFIEDFAHVMISDRNHWLYINPHVKGGKHSGKSVTDDPIIARYLADIFDSYWGLAEPINF